MKTNRNNTPTALSCLLGLLAVYALSQILGVIGHMVVQHNINQIYRLDTNR